VEIASGPIARHPDFIETGVAHAAVAASGGRRKIIRGGFVPRQP
jgi:hypothetical protein